MALEDQAQGYCKDFLESHQNVDVVYANTFVGVSVRFWAFNRNDNALRGIWNGDEKGRFEHYRDVGLDSHSADIERAIWFMMAMPIGGSSVRNLTHDQIGSSSFPTTNNLSMRTVSMALPNHQRTVYHSQPTIAGPSSGYHSAHPIALAPASSSPASQASGPQIRDNVDEHHAPVPADAIYVEVFSQLKDGKELFYFENEDQHYAKEGDQWEERTITAQDGKVYDCFLYTGRNSGKHFYTWSLRDAQPYVPVRDKESGKKGKGRR